MMDILYRLNNLFGGCTLYYFGEIGNMNPYDQIELLDLDVSNEKKMKLLVDCMNYISTAGHIATFADIYRDMNLPIIEVTNTYIPIISFCKQLIGFRYGFITKSKSVYLDSNELTSFDIISQDLIRKMDLSIKDIYSYIIK